MNSGEKNLHHYTHPLTLGLSVLGINCLSAVIAVNEIECRNPTETRENP